MYSETALYVKRCMQRRVRKLKSRVVKRRSGLTHVGYSDNIRVCCCTIQRMYSFFNVRIHNTKIMSIIIIVVVIAYRLTHPFFNHSRSNFTACCFPTLENCAAKTSHRCHKCLSFGNVWRAISSVILSSARQILCSTCAVTVIYSTIICLLLTYLLTVCNY